MKKKEPNKHLAELYHLCDAAPYSEDAEASIISAFINGHADIYKITEFLKPEHFYHRYWQPLYNICLKFSDLGIPTDAVSLYEQMREEGSDITPAVIASINFIPNHNLVYTARIIYEKWMKRELLFTVTTIAEKVYQDKSDVFDLLSESVEELTKIMDISNVDSDINFFEMLPAVFEDIKARSVATHDPGLYSDYFPSVNEMTGGLRSGDFISISGKDKHGKCHAKGTKILRFDGSLINVEDIKVGEVLMGPDSTPRNVLGVGRGFGDLYEIELIRYKNREKFVVNGEHILCLRRNEKTRKEFPEYINISVVDYLKWSKTLQKLYFLYRPGAIYYPEKQVDLEPYFLGLWLGDGHSKSCRITNEDAEIIKYLQEYANRLGMVYKLVDGNVHSITTGMNGNHQNKQSVQKFLHQNNLLSNKHIPEKYLINSEKDRLELLAGLIDSDGWVSGRGNRKSYAFTNKNEHLCDQIITLALSLGFSAGKHSRIAKLKSRNYECLVYNVIINGDLERIPVRVPHKKIIGQSPMRNHLSINFNVKNIGEGEYFGFQLDDDHLYLLSNFIVNHNTTLADTLLLDFAVNQGVPVAIFSLEMSRDTLAWKHISAECDIEYMKLRNPSGLKNGWGKITEEEMQRTSDSAYQKFKGTKIYIIDTVLNDRQIKAKMKKLIKEKGVKFFVIDYIGLIPTVQRYDTREREIAAISRFFKLATKELGCITCVLSQKNRDGQIAESLGLNRDTDFAFGISKPIEEGINTVDGITMTENDFLVTLERSRHSTQGRQWLCGYKGTAFRETSITHNVAPPPSDYYHNKEQQEEIF